MTYLNKFFSQSYFAGPRQDFFYSIRTAYFSGSQTFQKFLFCGSLIIVSITHGPL